VLVVQNEIVYLYLDDIIPNRFQPREVFDEEALKELAISIKEHGVIQPIIVRQVNNKYEIIAGERRYKASTMAGLTKIPAIIRNLDDKESSKVALIENLQRRDLTPIEEARTYQKILELENGMTQESLAQSMGKTQSAVSNKLRLLSLPEEVQYALLNEQISERHARSLLNLEDKNQQIRLLEKIIATRMTVKELEKEIKMYREQDPANSFGMYATNIPDDNAEETVAPYTAVELNPTEVDINRIRQNSVDINAPKPTANMSDLMNTGMNTASDFRFVPTDTGEDSSGVGNVGGGMNTTPGNAFGFDNSSNSFGVANSFEANPANAFAQNPVGVNNFGVNNSLMASGQASAPVDSLASFASVPIPTMPSVDSMATLSPVPFEPVPSAALSPNMNQSSLLGGVPMVNELPPMEFSAGNANVSAMDSFGASPTSDFGSTNLFGQSSVPQSMPDLPMSNQNTFVNPNSGVVNQMLSDIPSMNMQSEISNDFVNANIAAPKPDLMGSAQQSSIPSLMSNVSPSIGPDLMGGGLALGNVAKGNVMDAVNTLRGTVREIESLGFTVSIEELDASNEYQILIKINKD